MSQVLAFLKSHWASVAGLLMAVWAYAAPTVTTFITNHPKYSFWFGLGAVIVTFYWKSPLQKGPDA